MEKYEIIQMAGSGNFSDVYKALELETGDIVAIKDMRLVEDIQELIARQIKILKAVNHPNIIKTKQIIANGKDIKVVFEFISENLLEFYQNAKKGVSENQIKCILYQTAFALDYLHSEKKIIHRDIKPENILIDKKQAIVKVIDFGLAKQQELAATNYVATRWYRAPQNLVGMKKSSTAIDIFSLGCVIFQLATLTPLFPGENTVDQLAKIFQILGSPTQQNWLQGYNELKRKKVEVLSVQPISLKDLMPNSSDQLIDLLTKMITLDPKKRLRGRDIMLHPYFSKVQKVIPPSIYKQAYKYLKQIKLNQQKTKQNKTVIPNLLSMDNVNHTRKRSNLSQQKVDKQDSIIQSFTPRNTYHPNYQQPQQFMNKSIEKNPRVTINYPIPQVVSQKYETLKKTTFDPLIKASVTQQNIIPRFVSPQKFKAQQINNKMMNNPFRMQNNSQTFLRNGIPVGSPNINIVRSYPARIGR